MKDTFYGEDKDAREFVWCKIGAPEDTLCWDVKREVEDQTGEIQGGDGGHKRREVSYHFGNCVSQDITVSTIATDDPKSKWLKWWFLAYTTCPLRVGVDPAPCPPYLGI